MTEPRADRGPRAGSPRGVVVASGIKIQRLYWFETGFESCGLDPLTTVRGSAPAPPAYRNLRLLRHAFQSIWKSLESRNARANDPSVAGFSSSKVTQARAMPISDEALQKEKNRFIAVKSDAKLGQAIAALNALGGQPWWHIVVQQADGSWRAARISEIAASLAAQKNAAETALRDSTALRAVASADRYSLDTKIAQTVARKSEGGVLVVTDGAPVGILVEGVRRGGGASNTPGLALSSTSLDQLGGKYVKLKDYGSILLSCSKK